MGDSISKVIDLKSYTKDMLEAELRRAMECLEALQKERESLGCLYARTIHEFGARQSRAQIDPCDIEVFTRYLCHLRTQMDEKDRLVAEKGKEVKGKRRALQQAHAEKRALEIYQERILVQERTEEDKKEQRETDFRSITRRT